jgi:hypothetical protein
MEQSGSPRTRLRFYCSQHHQDHALFPTIAYLERAAGFRREDAAQQRLTSWRRCSRRSKDWRREHRC